MRRRFLGLPFGPTQAHRHDGGKRSSEKGERRGLRAFEEIVVKTQQPVSVVPQEVQYGQIDKGRVSRPEGKRHTFSLSSPPAGNIFAPGARL